MNKITGNLCFLGTGASAGVPVVGCHCPICISNNPRNKRFRTSALLTIDNKKILVDCGPDFRMQALIHHIDTLDGVILTHAHNDHTAGIDDLKVYCIREKKSLPCLLSSETEGDIVRRFQYLFNPKDEYRAISAHLKLETLPNSHGKIDFIGIPIRYFSYEQLQMKVNGFCIGNLAYITDICDYDERIFEDLHGIDTLVLSALRFTSSPMHLTVDEAVDFARKVGAKSTWIIHTSHELDYEKTNAYLPENVRMAYDGLSIQFQIEETN